MTSPAIDPIKISAMKCCSKFWGVARQLRLPIGSFFAGHWNHGPQAPRLAHACFFKDPMEMVEPTLARDRRHGTAADPI